MFAPRLLVSPDLVVQTGQVGVVNLLAELQARLGLSYLFIAHDLSVVRHISDRVAVMYLGKFVEVGTRSQVYDAPSEPELIDRG